MDTGLSAIIAAVIGVIGILIQIFISMKISENNKYHTKQQNFRQNEFIKNQNSDNMKFQERIENNKIDADLKASARINWIQDVRKLTAIYISDFYLFVNGKEKSWIDIQKNVELLILYFGQTEDTYQNKNNGMRIVNGKIEIDEKTRRILTNNKSNDGKNDFLGTYLSIHNDLFEQIDYKKIVSNIEKLENNIEAISRMINGIYMESEHIWNHEYVDSLNQIFPFIEDVIISEEDQIKIDKYNDEIDKYKLKIADERSKLEYHKVHLKYLRKIINIYLKIEWDIAKQGK